MKAANELYFLAAADILAEAVAYLQVQQRFASKPHAALYSLQRIEWEKGLMESGKSNEYGGYFSSQNEATLLLQYIPSIYRYTNATRVSNVTLTGNSSTRFIVFKKFRD